MDEETPSGLNRFLQWCLNRLNPSNYHRSLSIGDVLGVLAIPFALVGLVRLAFVTDIWAFLLIACLPIALGVFLPVFQHIMALLSVCLILGSLLSGFFWVIMVYGVAVEVPPFDLITVGVLFIIGILFGMTYLPSIEIISYTGPSYNE